jgi:predicted nucleic acid-binding protein
MAESVVLDASAMVEALAGTRLAAAVLARVRGCVLHVPAHFDVEVLSALGRLERAHHLTARQVQLRLERLAAAPVQRHPIPALLAGAWRRRHNLRLVDALYVELAERLGRVRVVTTDGGLAAAAPRADLVD